SKTHSQKEAEQFLADTTKDFKDNGLLQDMEAAYGLKLKKNPSLDPDARISSAELKQIENGTDPFAANLAAALRKDIPAFLSEHHKSTEEGGFLGLGSHPVDHVALNDLNYHLDMFEHERRAIELQSALLRGKSDSIFSAVAKSAGKNP